MASSSRSVQLRMGPVGSTSAGSGPHRRGLISCLHSRHCRTEKSKLLSDKDLPLAVHKLIVGFYEEAFNRLPREDMPDLLRLLTTNGGGSCLGLLDPVSNIILNTLALIPRDAAPASTSPPDTRRSKRVALNTTSIADLDAWDLVASMSYNGLFGFLMAYFGCLTSKQAIRYLYWAKGNLLLAIQLVQHDLYVVEGGFDAESDRIQAALEWAAGVAGHPSPTILAHLMSITLGKSDLALFKTMFSDRVRLTIDDVRAVHHIIHMLMSPKLSVNTFPIKRGMILKVREMPGCSKLTKDSPTVDGTTTSTIFHWGAGGTPISSLQFGVLPKLRDCLETADKGKKYLKNPCGGDACEYFQSLHMFLKGIIHNLYNQALSLLPTPSGPLMRSILKAGHCYGCMDPVSNIIINSIWYNTCGCSLSVSERKEMEAYNDLLDPLYLLRTQVQSLEGLTKLATFTDPKFLVPDCALELLELLCHAKCNIGNMLTSSWEMCEKIPFYEAAVAAGHPQPLSLGELHEQLLLMPDQRNELHSFITEAQSSGNVLCMADMTLCIKALWGRNRSVVRTVRAPQLCEGALRLVSSKRSEYEKRRSQLRPKIEQLLKQYMTQQFEETIYELDTILGVEERKIGYPPFLGIRCRVNFMATSDLGLHRTLFFAEFWLVSPEPRPEFCCLLPYAYVGRCYYGVHSARKIVYPDDAKYIPHDITHPGTSSVDGMLGMDLVYFSPKFDMELANKLNMLPSEEEEKNKKKSKKSVK